MAPTSAALLGIGGGLPQKLPQHLRGARERERLRAALPPAPMSMRTAANHLACLTVAYVSPGDRPPREHSRPREVARGVLLSLVSHDRASSKQSAAGHV